MTRLLCVVLMTKGRGQPHGAGTGLGETHRQERSELPDGLREYSPCLGDGSIYNEPPGLCYSLRPL